MAATPLPSHPASNPVLPAYSLEDRAILCQEPRLTSVRVSDLSEADFLAAYPHAWTALAHFDPAALTATTGGAISPERATQAKSLFAAELVAHSLEPRRGEQVPADKLYLRILNPAFDFLAAELRTQDYAGIARALAVILATDEATAGRLAEGRRQMRDR